MPHLVEYNHQSHLCVGESLSELFHDLALSVHGFQTIMKATKNRGKPSYAAFVRISKHGSAAVATVAC